MAKAGSPAEHPTQLSSNEEIGISSSPDLGALLDLHPARLFIEPTMRPKATKRLRWLPGILVAILACMVRFVVRSLTIRRSRCSSRTKVDRLTGTESSYVVPTHFGVGGAIAEPSVRGAEPRRDRRRPRTSREPRQ
jgi:hypothetical protein